MIGDHTHRLQRATVLAVFFLSGAAALGYQVLWSKHVLAFIGVSAYSYATVLAAFMAGLALGGRFLGRLADSSRSPLKLYAFLEIGIAAYAVLYPTLDRLVQAAYGALVGAPAESWDAATGMPFKILAAGLLLLPPTILMGATLPAMVRHATETLGVVGQRVSRLYAWNALGSAIGALAMAFVVIPGLGLAASLMLLAMVNLTVAVVALVLSWLGRGRSDAAPVGEAAPIVAVPMRHLGRGGERWMLAAAFTAGWLSFTYEIAWTRVLAMVLGSSTYAFAVMLAAFITGIALGSLALARLDATVHDPLRLFAWTQLAVAVLVAAPLPFYPLLPHALHLVETVLSTTTAAFYVYSAASYFLCFTLMLPPTVFIGMAIPLLVKGLSHHLERLGADTGRAYAWNTAGNVLGALTAGILFLPLLGAEWLLRSTVLVGVVLGVAALVGLPVAGRQRGRTLAAPLTIAAVVTLVVLVTDPWPVTAFTSEPFRRKGRSASPPQLDVAFAADDPAGHILVASSPAHGNELSLWINGKADASSYHDMPTQLAVSHLPLLLHPDPHQVLVIGLASGASAGAALLHPVARVDVVEIMRRMPEATRAFAAVNRQPWTDPRFNLVIDDARSFLSHTESRYDVVISEPSNPWVAGCAALFSTDFYRVILDKLEPDGLYVQWIQAYELRDETLAAMIRTFRLAFPYVYGFQGSASDLIFVGSRQPLTPDWTTVAARLTAGEVGADLLRAGIPDLETLLFLQRFSPATVDALAAATDLVTTDDNLLLEYQAPLDLFQRAWPEHIDTEDERRILAPSLFWSERRRQLQAAGRILASPYEPFALDARIAHPVVTKIAHEVEFHNLGLGLALLRHRKGIAVFEEWVLTPPLTEAEIDQAILQTLRDGHTVVSGRLIAQHREAIIHESTLSPAAAARWAGHLADWRSAAGGGPLASDLHRLQIDLAAAGDDRARAAVDLGRWLTSDPPPPPVWALLTACRLERGELCRAAASAGLERTGDPFFARYLELLGQR